MVMDSSGGHRRLPGGSDHFLLQTNRQTLHHNIFISSSSSTPANLKATLRVDDHSVPDEVGLDIHLQVL